MLNIRRWCGFSLIWLIVAMTSFPVWSESNIESIRAKFREAINNRNYYGEYTEITFRFGRRQEVSYRVWAWKRALLKQTQSPQWLRGEITYETENLSLFYIPALNSGLRLEHSKSDNKKTLSEWRNWIDRVTFAEGETTIAGRPVFNLSGAEKDLRYRLSIDKEAFYPVAYEIYRKEFLIKSFHFHRFEKIAPDFDPIASFPANVKWYENGTRFWQENSIPRSQQGVNFPIEMPAYLPEGYVFMKATIEELSLATAVHLVFEGPEGRKLSVFEREKLSEHQRFTLNQFQEYTKAGQTFLVHQWFDNQIHYVLVGSVPLDELKKIAASFK